jgi:hypothetical protein
MTVFAIETIQAIEIAMLIVILIFALVNLGAALLYRVARNKFRSPHEIMVIGYTDRFEPLRPYLSDWFDLKDSDWDAFAKEWDHYTISAFAYDPLCEYKHPEWKSRFINTAPQGFRHGKNQGEWPPDKAYFNIFFFGASALHQLGADWATISSYLQETLNRYGRQGEVRLYNFGRAAYFSSLEKTLLFKILADGIKPDLALFFDGSTDVLFYHGLPATHSVITKAIGDMVRELNAEASKKRKAVPKWNLLQDFFSSLPLLHLISIMRRRKADVKPIQTETPLTEEQINQVIDRWLSNRRQIEAVCKSYGVPVVFIWHPTPAYKYDLAHHVALPHFGGLHGHERAGAAYQRMRTRLGDDYNTGNLIWLADLQEGREEPLYIDTVHFTAGFSRVIAESVAEQLIERGFIPR